MNRVQPELACQPACHRDGEHPTGQLRLLLAGTLAAFAGYALLLSVVPMWASASGKSESSAGATTGVFMAATVAAQLVMPWLLGRVGYRAALITGSVLLGVPAPLYLASTSTWALLAITAVRGLGFGLLTVSGNALAAELVPAERRGRAAGLFGAVAGLSLLGGLPISVWIAQHVSYSVVFVAAGVLAVLAVPPVLAITDPVARRARHETALVSAGTRLSRMVAPSVVVLTGTVGFGAVLTFLPIVRGGIAPFALFALNGGPIVGRWMGGVLGDRIGSAGRLLAPGVAAVASGLFACALGMHLHGASSALILMVGSALCGSGLGVVQNVTLVVMFDRAGSTGYGLASTVWNVGFDAGTGIGAVVSGAVLSWGGAPGAFALAGLFAVAALPVALAITRSTVPSV